MQYLSFCFLSAIYFFFFAQFLVTKKRRVILRASLLHICLFLITLDIKALLESKMKMRMMTDITFVVFKATPM
jgi:hypothetical protein